MPDVSWIKITTTMFDDDKIRLIEMMPEKDTILIIWVKLLIQAGRSNASGYICINENLPYSEEMLSTIFNRPLNSVRLALDTFSRFGMIERSKSGVLISNWGKHQNIKGLEDIREQNRLRVQRHRAAKALPEPESELPLELKTKNKSKRVTLLVALPVTLQTEEFEIAWDAWHKHRKEKGNRLTPSTEKLQLKQMEKIGSEEAAKRIYFSIEKGYTGIFEDKASGGKAQTPDNDLDKAMQAYGRKV